MRTVLPCARVAAGDIGLLVHWNPLRSDKGEPAAEAEVLPMGLPMDDGAPALRARRTELPAGDPWDAKADGGAGG